jgi:hypothetical protein
MRLEDERIMTLFYELENLYKILDSRSYNWFDFSTSYTRIRKWQDQRTDLSSETSVFRRWGARIMKRFLSPFMLRNLVESE